MSVASGLYMENYIYEFSIIIWNCVVLFCLFFNFIANHCIVPIAK